MSDSVIYEYPLGERTRLLLRLERLFAQLKQTHQDASIWSSRAFVLTLLDVLELTLRGDLKADLIKDLERASGNLSRLLQAPGVNTDRL